MGYACIYEMRPIILLIIESYDFIDTDIVKYFNILVRMLPIPMLSISVLNWSHECNKLSWDDPVEISILNSLIIFILLDIKCAEIVPSEPNSVLKTLQAMEKCAVVEALALGGISVVANYRHV